MAISTVRVQINGTWTNLTYNSATGAYEATITAPSATSFNRTGGYYPVTVEAKNSVGTVTTVNDSNPSLGASCKLVVKEKTIPVITINSPTSGARVTNSKQPVVFTITDESGGIGDHDRLQACAVPESIFVNERDRVVHRNGGQGGTILECFTANILHTVFNHNSLNITAVIVPRCIRCNDCPTKFRSKLCISIIRFS